MGASFSSYDRTIKDIEKNEAGNDVLDFSNQPLGDKKLQKMSGSIHENSTLRKLILANTNITGVGVRHLTDALVSSLQPNNVTVIVLDNNPLGPDGAQYLSNAIQQCRSLQTLKVNKCGLGDDGASHIARSLVSSDHLSSSLVTLELGSNLLSDNAAEAFGAALASNDRLEGLSLWNNSILAAGAKYLAEGLTRNTSLRWLGLGKNNVGASGAQEFADRLPAMSVQWLALGGNDLGDNGVIALTTALQDDGCALQSLGLGGNGITDQAAHYLGRALWNNNILESLGLGGNSIGSSGCEHLAEMMNNNTALRKLILSSNQVDDDAICALAEGISVNKTLDTLLVANNDFTMAGMSVFIQKLLSNKESALRTLDIHDCELEPEQEERVLAELRNKSQLEQVGSFVNEVPDHRLKESHERNMLPDQTRRIHSSLRDHEGF